MGTKTQELGFFGVIKSKYYQWTESLFGPELLTFPRNPNEIPDLISELQNFSIELQDSLRNKNLPEIEETVQHFETINSKSCPGRREMKLCIIEQQHLIAEADQYGNYTYERSGLNKKHVDNVLKNFQKYLNPETRLAYLTSAHAKENAAALFTSRPKEMQAYLKVRQENDYALLETFLKTQQ